RSGPGAGSRAHSGTGDGAGTRSGRRVAALALRASRSAAVSRARRPRSGTAHTDGCARDPRAPGRDGPARGLNAGRPSLKLGARCIVASTPAWEPLRCVSTLPDVHQNVARAGSTARVFVQAAREELRQRHDGVAGGLAVVAAYTDAIDHLVQWLFDNATVHYQ